MAANLYYWIIATAILGLLLILPSLMGLFSSNKFDVNGRTILLTGASEGMGKSVAKQLAAKGANIIIVARNVSKLEAALEEVKASASTPSQRFHCISSDVTDPDAASQVITEATTWNNGQPLDIVWCIAGSSAPGLFIETSRDILRRQMDINYWSCVDMAQAILSQWLSPSALQTNAIANTKHLIFTSSVVAFYPVAGYAPYAPTKAAIKNLSDSLAQEILLYGDQVQIHTIFPGTISSPGLENENKTKPHITHILEGVDPVQTPDAVASASIKGLERGEYLVTVGWLGDAMRGCAWGGSRRNNWLLDTFVTWVTSLVWFFIGMDMDGKVRKYGRENGHPSTYRKTESA